MAPASYNCIFNTICVMDASSRLGTKLVKRLLKRDYTVHAAVQNHGESLSLKRIECDYKKKLKIFESDPFDYHSLLAALKGCSALFYSFQPPSDYPTYDEDIAEVEVRAAHNVLEACAQTETIEKVVFTSSATAIIWGHDKQSTSTHYIDERHWTDINFCRKFKLWHAMSKTLAEKAAWALAMDRGINMVTINAGLLMGPDLTIANPYLKGAAEMYEDGVFVTVDLHFLVDAHICVYEEIASYGRYLCFNHIINQQQDAFQLAKMLSPLSSPPQSMENDTRIIQQRISNKKLNKLMVEFKGCQSQMEQNLVLVRLRVEGVGLFLILEVRFNSEREDLRQVDLVITRVRISGPSGTSMVSCFPFMTICNRRIVFFNL